MSGRARGDRGQVGGIEVLPFGLLTFVSATLLLVNAWGVLDAKFAVTAAARESVRAFVEADSLTEATAASARRGSETLEAYGRTGPDASVGAPVLDGPFGRCARVSVTVSVDLPAIRVPFIGGFGSSTAVESTHSALVDPYRSDVEGPSGC